MAKKPEAKKAVAKAAPAPKQTRTELNDQARYDYGILNASDMSEKQVRAEIAVIDKQKADAVVADQKARAEQAKTEKEDA